MRTGSTKDTPIMRQYRAAKASYPDAILFFRLGDFYEMFYEDALLGAKVLELTLTSRNKGAPDEIPMAGVPYHAAHGYIARLLSRGYKIALCEQMADPSKTRGIVPREVVRVITPGLVTDSDQLDARTNHFLACVEQREQESLFGLALLDLSTGELRAACVEGSSSLLAELVRAAPREVLVSSSMAEVHQALTAALPQAVVREEASTLDASEAIDVIEQTVGAQPAKEAQQRLVPVALSAAARALRFACACSPGVRLPVTHIEPWEPRDTLLLDEVAQKHLELVSAADGSAQGSLLSLLDTTCTPQGARLLRRRLLAPLLDVASIRRRHDAVELFVIHPAVRSELRRALENVADLERLAVRTSLREATPKDLGALRDTLLATPDVNNALASIPDPSARSVFGLEHEPLDMLSDLTAHLRAALADRPPPLVKDGGIFRLGFHAQLDELRALQTQGTKHLTELEAKLRAETGATTLKVKYTRVFGWYLEVTGKYLDRVPSTWRRKQTVSGGERYTNDDLDTLSDKLLHAEERAQELESSLYKELLDEVARHAPRLHRLALRLAEWDVHAALADVAHRYDYVRPEVDESVSLDLVDGRHPVVERLAAAGQFVPNSVRLNAEQEGERLWLITGPNMAGKSTLMRQVALSVLLAQMGSYVPASRARIGVVDRVLSRVGASDNVARGESTFMVEMRETSSILRLATKRSLVILDEIGRGTSTYDGLAIAWAVAEHLHDICRCRTLFATHYHELTDFARQAPYAENYSVSARELGDDIVFLHKLCAGEANRSYGLAVAKLAGLPEGVLARSKAILASLEKGGALPGGSYATLRGRRASGKAQLDLFASAAGNPSEQDSKHPVLETLRAVDPERLSPLEALSLIVKLKAMVSS